VLSCRLLHVFKWHTVHRNKVVNYCEYFIIFIKIVTNVSWLFIIKKCKSFTAIRSNVYLYLLQLSVNIKCQCRCTV